MIKFILLFTTSLKDSSGNCYHAVHITDTLTGKATCGTVDCVSPAPFIKEMGLDLRDVWYVERHMGKTDFKNYIANYGMRYATAVDLACAFSKN